MTQLRTGAEGADTSRVRDGRPGSVDGVDSDDLRQTLTTRAGEVVCAERQRALRSFEDGRRTAARRALSTMAVRIAVQLVEPALLATEVDDDHLTETVADLYLGE